MSRGRRGGGSGWANGPSLHNGPNLHGLETTLNVCGLAIWSDTAAWTPARAQAQQRARLGRGGARAQSLGRWQASGPHGCGRRMLSVHRAEPAPARSPAPVNATSALAHPRAPGSPPTGVKADSRRRPEPRQLPTQHTAPQATAEGATSLPSGVWRSSPALCPATASLLSGSRRKRDPRWGASECPASGPAQRSRVTGACGWRLPPSQPQTQPGSTPGLCSHTRTLTDLTQQDFQECQS